METIANGIDDALDARVFREMFEERKRVFVDLLGWDIPTLASRYEIDQFDDDHAVYIVIVGDDGRHCGSARLLRTDRPHILDTLFPDLAGAGLPNGDTVREITRFCLARRLRSGERLQIRNRLVSALVDHAFASGISTYTGVAEVPWFRQIMQFGWDCSVLGERKPESPEQLVAMRIAISADTPRKLRSNGIYTPTPLVPLDRAAA